ncbi:MAG: sialate O-acetylesterase [Ignavibacteriales bacterium]|nr:sialate O-acetylesterase [Ignavibacteriales bacterium]
MKKIIFLITVLFPILLFSQTRNIVPRNDGEGQLGTLLKAWGKVHADSIFLGGTSLHTLESTVTSLQNSIHNVFDLLSIEPPVSGYINSAGDHVYHAEYLHTSAISIAEVGETVLADFYANGGSVYPITYYNSSTISSANKVGNEKPNPDQQYNKYALNIPASATHFVISAYYLADLNVYALRDFNDLDSRVANNEDRLLVQEDVIIVDDAYISRTTGLSIYHLDFYRSLPIRIDTFNQDFLFVDVGSESGSCLPVSYYSSEEISAETWLGGEVSASPSQLLKYKLTPPAGATHVVLSCQPTYDIRFYRMSNLDEQEQDITALQPLFYGGDLFRSLNANPFGDEAVSIQKRASLDYTLPDGYYPLFIMLGQSNADGRVPYTSAPSFLTSNGGVIDNYMLWDKTNSKFSSYESGVNVGSDNNADTRFSFDIYFANEWLTANPGKKMYLIKHTLGASSIIESTGEPGVWQPKIELIVSGQRKLAEELATKVLLALNYARQNNIKLVPVAILFHQGENDALTTAGRDAYEQNLKNLISFIRGMFVAPTLPFINATIVPTAEPYAPDINSVFSTLNSLDKFMKTVDMAGHYTTIDGVHYDEPAINYMGTSMYAKYLTLHYPTY